jgi:hypothetical protein
MVVYGRIYVGRYGYDFKNKRFGCLVAISHTTFNEKRVWKCLCDCGKFTLVETRNLIRYPDRKCEHGKNTAVI